RPAAPSSREPVHTEVTKRADAPWRRRKLSTGWSSASAAWPRPPGTNRMSSGGQSSSDTVGSSARPDSACTGWVSFQTRCTRAPGRRCSTSNGPVRSSWVRPGKSSIPMCSAGGVASGAVVPGVVVIGHLPFVSLCLGFSACNLFSGIGGAVAAMTTIGYFLPMPRVLIVAFEGAQTLDVTGPAEVFAAVARVTGRPHYRVLLASMGGGARGLSSSLAVATRDLARLRPRPDDTVIVAGGEEAGLRDALRGGRLVAWLRGAARVVRRMSSVCSGAFILAAAGLLDGKRAATHWMSCEPLA